MEVGRARAEVSNSDSVSAATTEPGGPLYIKDLHPWV